MAFSEEIKLEAMSQKRIIRSIELPVYYKERHGVSNLRIWRDGFYNLFFLFRKRFGLLGAVPPLVKPGSASLQKKSHA